MKFYIASRFDKKPEVLELHKYLREKGHEILADWTGHKFVKPYDKNEELAGEYAANDINGAKDCDVFVVLSDDGGTGMYVELGAAIASNLLRGKPKIYVIGEHPSRSMFYYHPSVTRKNNLGEALDDVSS